MAELAIKLTDIAHFLGGTIEGDQNVVIKSVKPLSDAGPDDLSFYDNDKYADQFMNTRAGAVLIAPGMASHGKTVITVDAPYVAFARLLQHFCPKPPIPHQGVSPQAIIAPDAVIGSNVHIAPGVYVGAKTTIGDETVIWPGTVIGPGCTIGSHCTIFSNVSIYYGCTIGDRVILHAGVVIGADGFGFAQTGKEHLKIPQIGNVMIEDDVEIGANSTVDRAAMGTTRIGGGTKIDNLVQVAHNCQIGAHCILVSQVGVSGSAKLGKHVVVAGQSGIAGHIEVGDYAQVGGQSGVTKSLEGGKQYLGAPAMPAREFKRLLASTWQTPKLVEKIKALEKKLENLEAKAGGDAPS